MAFLYIKENKEWGNKYKYGITNNLSARLHAGHELLSYPTRYIAAWEIARNARIDKNWEIDTIFSQISQKEDTMMDVQRHHNNKTQLPHLRNFAKYVIQHPGGGTEFMKCEGMPDFARVVNNEFKYFGLSIIKKLSIDELDLPPSEHVDLCETINNTRFCVENIPVIGDGLDAVKETPVINADGDRDYQTSAINLMVDGLVRDSRTSLDLATGAGKSRCVYRVINQIKPKSVLIISPLKHIRNQNIANNYTGLLDSKYSSSVNFNNTDYDKQNIVSICMQSVALNLDNIKKLQQPLLLWIDEAHWGYENCGEDALSNVNEYIFNDAHPTQRVFTSATWDYAKHSVQKYGEIVNTISPAELIKQNWLCGLKPYIFATSDVNTNYAKYMNMEFTALGCTRGMVVCNNITNAVALFKNLYTAYKDKESVNRPFLYVGDEKKANIRDILYGYNDIKEYENYDGCSIVVAVQKISMGYDYRKIDFIAFPTARHSRQDIMQIIGRGLRPDALGPYGKNANKKLNILLFTYGDMLANDAFNEIKDVLSALVCDYELLCGDIEIRGNGGECADGSAAAADGIEAMNSRLMHIIAHHSLAGFISMLKRAGVVDIDTYHDHRRKMLVEHNELNAGAGLELPINPFSIKSKSDTFRFELLFNGGVYYSRADCEDAIKKIKLKYMHIKKIKSNVKFMIECNVIDVNIPPSNFEKFYGRD